MKTIKIYFLSGLLLFAAFSCSDDFLTVKTTGSLTSADAEAALKADPTKLESFVNAIYSLMVQFDLVSESHDAFGLMSILHSTDMMGEDIVQSKFHWFGYDYEHDNHEMTYRRTLTDWTYLYSIISNANIVINMTSDNTEQFKPFRGQAFALRGMAYYYLIQLYQHTYNFQISKNLPGIPMYYALNEGKANINGRATVEQVYTQIEADLTKGIELLEGWDRGNKNQIDYYVANGLLARFYLLSEQWEKANDAATKALEPYEIMSKEDLHDGFMNINNKEWMWGFDHTAETSTVYASFFSHMSNIAPGYAGLNYAPRHIDRRLFDQIPLTDERRKLFQDEDTMTITADELTSSNMESTSATAWKLPYANVKFGWDGNWTMDYPYMRAAEMVLIQAEALAEMGLTSEAASKLSVLMVNRDPAWNKTDVTPEEVYLQRRIELWGEGFSFFDLKRLNKGIDRTYAGTNHPANGQIKVAAKAKTWIYQIPQSEMQENTAIKENNE